MSSAIRKNIFERFSKLGISKEYAMQIVEACEYRESSIKRIIYSTAMNIANDDDALALISVMYREDAEDIRGIRDRMVRKQHDREDFGSSALETIDLVENLPVALHETCGKCKIPETVVSLGMRQVRSADEGETAFFMCKRCRTQWRR